MPHNIRVAVIGEDEYVPRLVRAILDQEIIPAANMYLSEQDKPAVEAAAGRGVQLCESSAAAVVNSEIVLVCASKREMGTELAPISQCTRGRTLVSICSHEAVNIAFVKERVVFGTEIIAATVHRDENNKLYATYAIDEGVRLFLHQPCRDMVDALCRSPEF